MNTGIILTIVGGVLAIFTYVFMPFITIVEDAVSIHAWQVATGQAALLANLLAVALAIWALRSRRQAAGWGLAALALGQIALLVLTYARVWALVPARALGLRADPQTGGLVDGTLVMLDWGFALAAGQAAGALFAGLLVVSAHREFLKNQRFLKLAVQWGGQSVLERVLFDARPVTVGEADDALIQLAAGGLASHLLLQPCGTERYSLHVPAFAQGQLHLRGERVEAAGQSAEIGPGDAGVLWFDNDVSLVFGFVGAESATLAPGLGRDPGLAVSMAATTAVTLLLLLAMLSGHKMRQKADGDEFAEAKRLESIAITIAEAPKPDGKVAEPARSTENAPPAPIGPPADHRPPKVGLPDRVGPTTVAKNDKPRGPIDVSKLGIAGELTRVPLDSAMGKILQGEQGPLASTSPLAVGGDDPSSEIGGGSSRIGFKDGGHGGDGDDPWVLVGMPNGRDPDGRDRRTTVAIGRKSPKKVPPTVVGSGTTLGGCDKGDIAKQVRARGSMVRACYEMQLLSTPTLQGKLAVQWTIAGDGSVTGEKVASTSMVDENRVSDCVLRTIRRIRFEAPQAGTCVIQWPFVFSPG